MDENGKVFNIKVSARTLRALKKQDKVVG